MSLIIEKLEGGYVVTHHTTRQVATAEHVANLIMRYWPDVIAHLRLLVDGSVEKNLPD
jgi:hypothetical protein